MGTAVAWLIANLPGWAWLVLLGLLGLALMRQWPLLLGLALGGVLRLGGGAARGLHASPMTTLVVVVIACAAIGHALGVGDGGPAPAAAGPASAGGAPAPAVATGKPISCPGMVLTQGYGPTDLAGEPIINGVRFHTGWDLACPAGTAITSVTAGTAHVTLGYGGGFGNNVQIHVGNLWVRYAHMEATRVADGAQVAPGTVLGLEGATGFATGPHLHFEVDRGCSNINCSIDPANLIPLPVGR